MTTKEIAEIAGVSIETVRVKGKELFPFKFENGKKTVFTKTEAITIMSALRKKGFIQPTENLEAPTENMELLKKSDIVEVIKTIVSEVIKQAIPMLIQNQAQKQIAFEQNYYSIKGYANLKKVHLTFSEAKQLGREASRISRERDIPINRVPDEQYGEIGSYRVDILREVFALEE